GLVERALVLEPGFAQAHVALAESLAYLGYEAQARDEAKRAFELAAKLPDDERLGVEGQYYSLNGNESGAAEAYGKLWKRFPDSLEWGMRFASAQLSSGDENGRHPAFASLRQV